MSHTTVWHGSQSPPPTPVRIRRNRPSQNKANYRVSICRLAWHCRRHTACPIGNRQADISGKPPPVRSCLPPGTDHTPRERRIPPGPAFLFFWSGDENRFPVGPLVQHGLMGLRGLVQGKFLAHHRDQHPIGQTASKLGVNSSQVLVTRVP